MQKTHEKVVVRLHGSVAKWTFLNIVSDTVYCDGYNVLGRFIIIH